MLFLELENFHNTKNGCRYGKASNCKSCRSIRNKNRYKLVREDMLATKALQYKENKELFSARARAYREQNPEKIKENRRSWGKENAGRRSASVAFRRAMKKKATLSWLTKAHREKMVLYYRLAKKLSKINNIAYHVDHIVPLQGSNVCGLHVPWNLQVIPAKENLSKYNSF